MARLGRSPALKKIDLNLLPGVNNNISTLTYNLNSVTSSNGAIQSRLYALLGQNHNTRKTIEEYMSEVESAIENRYGPAMATLNGGETIPGSMLNIAKKAATDAMNIITEGAAIEADTFLEIKQFIDDNAASITEMANAAQAYTDSQITALISNELAGIYDEIGVVSENAERLTREATNPAEVMSTIVSNFKTISYAINEDDATSTPSILIFPTDDATRGNFNSVAISQDCTIYTEDGRILVSSASISPTDPFKVVFELPSGETVKSGVVAGLFGLFVPALGNY